MPGLNHFDNTVTVRITTADTTKILVEIASSGIRLQQLQQLDELTVDATLHSRDFSALEEICKQREAQITIQHRRGLFLLLSAAASRPVLIAGICFLLALTLFLPTKVLFICVEGNEAVPAQQILAAAEECGVFFGASRQALRSESVKNKLLSALPQLQWVGVNTKGCVAVISVRERTLTEKKGSPGGVSSIVAACDGVIRSFTVTSGQPVCRIGQAVTKGELLVSGYTDLGTHIRAQAAAGEIYAETNRELTALIPTNFAVKGEIAGKERKYSLILGKKRINFCNSSGISGAVCDKMYKEIPLVLPGGFQLPVILAIEETLYRYPMQIEEAGADSMNHAQQFMEEYLLSQMVSGQILRQALQTEDTQEGLCVYGRYVCQEMIGRIRSEEIILHNGKND